MSEKSILIVDDELLIRDLLYDFFVEQGWKTSIAENGQKALDILEDKDIDLVLTDLRMPDMDGMVLTSEMHASYPDIPVVIMTAYPSVDTAVEALRNRVVDYVTKPFNINRLYKTVQAQLDTDKKEENRL
ncbi:MAG: response regulator [candidate division Zixibacteria bacterium]|nr:response regulator [candidate division Zixibacteria bacterium]